MNPTILPPAIGKTVGQSELFNRGIATYLGEGKFWIQTNYKPGEGWSPPGCSCPRHAPWIMLPTLTKLG